MDVHQRGQAAMGRIVSPNWLVDIAAHLVLSFVYAAIIASAIYSLPTADGIALGTFLALPIYGVNSLILRQLFGFSGNHLHVGIAHFIFDLFFR
jgi:hypothetical protein